jgi:hypothetical protein
MLPSNQITAEVEPVQNGQRLREYDYYTPTVNICWGRAMTARRSPTIPAGSWPLEMRAEKAAAYCDEPSVEAFLTKVNRGIYSKPNRDMDCLPKWHRLKLDRDIAKRHGLRFDDISLAEDAADLI